ncbi:MAG: Undecaprenyl-phosphate alpha-N-acetylglucosaminyl 1-phosphate transferase [Alphaproteobacteria bacterium]|nr:MAG: Undecaprenyl-phosphate alpha-N-acetylglucosaminyl 1-phosphate transferase [Alphaproteobacteria bacterium]
MLALIYISIVATLLATVLVIALRPLAIRLQLVDKPDARKTHKGDVPLLGGPVIWLVIVTGIILLIPNPPWSIVLAATMLVILGMVDDRQPVSARLKLMFHLAAATIVVMGEKLGISDIGIFHELFNVSALGNLHAVLAVIAIATAINAFNFIDGIDGLSASMALLALTHTNLAFNLIHGSTPPDYAFFAVLMSGALAGFLLFNLQVFNGRKIFLGDSGSMLIGLLVAVALIGASQATGRLGGNPTIPASLCLWLIAIPLTDMMSIIIRRLAGGRSPMAPDRTHIHHKIMEAGFSARRTLLIMILSSVGAFWLGFGLMLEFGEAASIIGFVVFVPSYYYAVQRIGVLVAYLR